MRWTIEQVHREHKQLTGVQTYQCRLGRNQLNHITLAERTWPYLSRFAYQTNQTVYQLRQGLFEVCLCYEMAQPTLACA